MVSQAPDAWLRLSTRRVIACFMEALARSHGWHKVFVISPWISEFGDTAGLSFAQFLKRLKDDDATAYIVSRPPKDDWHYAALNKLASSGKANIALVPTLHSKLYCAETDQGSLALIGSANFTELSLRNREIGILIRGSGEGRSIVRQLSTEASDIYRTPGRTVFSQRVFN